MRSWLKLRVPFLVFFAAGVGRGETTFFQARIAPVLDRHCVVCHGVEKKKAGLRLDSYDWLMKGAESGPVVIPGDAKASELYRRITLPASEEEVMPSDGKPLLSRDEIKNIELWLNGGASPTKVVADFPGAPSLSRAKATVPPLAPDWRPYAAEIAALERTLGVKLIARSQMATDGLILRTASAPRRCTDMVLGKLAPLASLIVEAELARTAVTDLGLGSVAKWENLRSLDLTRTTVTSRGLEALAGMNKLESLNLTETAVDDEALPRLKALTGLRRIWVYGTKLTLPVSTGDSLMPP